MSMTLLNPSPTGEITFTGMGHVRYGIIGKAKDPLKNEDIVRISDDFLFLGDGATSSAPFEGRPGGIVAGERVAEVIRSMPVDINAAGFVNLATTALRDLAASWDGNSRYRACVQTLVYSRARREIWRIGDCHFSVDGKVNLGSKAVDTFANDIRKTYLTNMLLRGITQEELLKTELSLPNRPWRKVPEYFQGLVQNLHSKNPYSYGTLDGTLVPEDAIQVFQVPAGSRVVFCTDGFPEPPESFEAGLRMLAELKQRDPLLIHEFVNNRSFPEDSELYDDTSGIWFNA